MSGPIGEGVRAARSPVLLTSLASAVLADGDGDVRLACESRGAVSEWGGVYGQLVRLTGPWTLELESDGRTSDLPSSRVNSSMIPGGWRSEHRWNDWEIEQHLVAVDHPAGVLRQLRVHSTSTASRILTITSRVIPYLFPVLVEGIRPIDFEVRTTADGLAVRHQGFGFRVSHSIAPSYVFVNRGSWIGGKYRGPVSELACQHELTVPPGGSAEIRWKVAGGLVRDLEAAVSASEAGLGSPEELAARGAELEQRWTEGTPALEFPDDPALESAYRSARGALRRLYSAPDDTMVGLVAGYPWYSAIWSRDLA